MARIPYGEVPYGECSLYWPSVVATDTVGCK